MPKRDAHKRTIAIDTDLATLLAAQVDRLRQIVAGIPDGAGVDLGLVRLPDDCLLFPAMPGPGEQFSATRSRCPNAVSKLFKTRVRKIGFAKVRLHDLCSGHETALLDAGVPVHVVAKRCAHDPAVLLRVYARHTRKADQKAARPVAMLAKGGLG